MKNDLMIGNTIVRELGLRKLYTLISIKSYLNNPLFKTRVIFSCWQIQLKQNFKSNSADKYYMPVKYKFKKMIWLFDQQLFFVKGNLIGLKATIMQDIL